MLDTAKTNQTNSIETLRKFSDLMVAMEKIKSICKERNYSDAIGCLKGINMLSNFFKPHASINQVAAAMKEKDEIISKVKLQILDDFSYFFKDISEVDHSNLHHACKLAEVLGAKFRQEVVHIAEDFLLKSYTDLYSRSENQTLESVEQRYSWFNRELREFTRKFSAAFPNYWGILTFIAHEFCGTTRVQLMTILDKSGSQTDVKNLLNALRATIKFENKLYEDLRKEYQQYINQPGVTKKNKDDFGDKDDEEYLEEQYRIEQIPKIKGSISNCFEMHMKPYVDTEESELRDGIIKELMSDFEDPEKNSLQSEDLAILNSSLIMFTKIKHLLKRASTLSRTQTMQDVYNVIRRNILIYLNELNNKIVRDEKNSRKDEAKFFRDVCILLNTVDYIKETLQSVHDSLHNLLDEPFNDQIDFKNEEDQCVTYLNGFVNIIKGTLDTKLNLIFNNHLLKLPLDKMEDHPMNSSTYVENIKMEVSGLVFLVRDKMNNVYFTKLLNSICQSINLKFIDTIYKFKRISEKGGRQLQLGKFIVAKNNRLWRNQKNLV